MTLDLFDFLVLAGLIFLGIAAYLFFGFAAVLGIVGATMVALGLAGAWRNGGERKLQHRRQ